MNAEKWVIILLTPHLLGFKLLYLQLLLYRFVFFHRYELFLFFRCGSHVVTRIIHKALQNEQKKNNK